jgi:hypothetical protein
MPSLFDIKLEVKSPCWYVLLSVSIAELPDDTDIVLMVRIVRIVRIVLFFAILSPSCKLGNCPIFSTA